MISAPTTAAIAAAATILQRGGLVAFPTETVYGLGGDANNRDAVEAIYQAKGRPNSNPLIVHVADTVSIAGLTRLDDPKIADRLKKLSVLWPGPLSLIIPAKAGIAAVEVAGLKTIAVRIPDHPVALKLIKAAKLAIAAPSANPSNFISPTSAQHVEQFLDSKVEMILDGGLCNLGIESSVVDISSERVVVFRPGFVLPETIAMLLGEEVSFAVESAHIALSPGLAATHYSPRTKLSFASSPPQNIKHMRFGYIAFSDVSSLPSSLIPAKQLTLSQNTDLAQIAAGLYLALHQLDQMQLDWILIDQCVKSGLGIAIMDRLSRAISKEI